MMSTMIIYYLVKKKRGLIRKLILICRCDETACVGKYVDKQGPIMICRIVLRVCCVEIYKKFPNYEGRSKSSRKCATIFLFCKSAELNYYSYIDKHYLYLYSKFCCFGMNRILTVVAMETVHHDYRPTFVHFCKKSMFNDDVAFDSLPCFFHQTLYEQSSICLR